MTTGKFTLAAHPALVTVVALVNMARAISLPVPEFWQAKSAVVKLLPTTTSLLVEEESARSGPPRAMVMTSPAVLFTAS